jgi:uncharacterized cupredoxin-like copper-binding protein
MNRRILSACGALALAALVATACGTGSKNASTSISGERTGTPVAVTEKEWAITGTPVTVKAGEVRFTVKNGGATVHELIVAKTDTDISKFPTYAATDTPAEGHSVGDVDEDKVPAVGELDDIAAGGTKDVTFALSAGKYVLFCNLPAHYSQGMRVGFTVQ